MKRPQKRTLAVTPTPLQELSQTSARLNKELYVKRDDLTGLTLSGNKIRKLEFILHDALAKDADTVVTFGGIQSNHVRATAVAARALGLDTTAVILGEKPSVFDGNSLLTAVTGAEFVYEPDFDLENLDGIYKIFEKRIRSRGGTPYHIPLGASNPLGCWGYITMMEELSRQQESMNIQFDSLFVATGSCGTHAGLLLGKYLTGNPLSVYGIRVHPGIDSLRWTDRLCRKTVAEFDLPVDYRTSDIHVYSDYIGGGYAQTSDREMEFILQVAHSEGIFLDHAYTGKAFSGMVDQLERYPERYGDTVLFVHTGGLFGITAERERITRLVREE